jgi:hypothetical protein
MALTQLASRAWTRLFGSRWSNGNEPPVKFIRKMAEAGLKHFGQSPPVDWIVALAANTWRHGFESGVLWGEKDYAHRVGDFPPDEAVAGEEERDAW